MQEKTKKPHFDFDFFEDLTGDIPLEPPKSVDDVGDRILRIREEKDLSLDEISKMTGFDVEFLSKIENKELQPQLGTVIKLSKALDSAFGRLVSGVGRKALLHHPQKRAPHDLTLHIQKRTKANLYLQKPGAGCERASHGGFFGPARGRSRKGNFTSRWRRVHLCTGRGSDIRNRGR